MKVAISPHAKGQTKSLTIDSSQWHGRLLLLLVVCMPIIIGAAITSAFTAKSRWSDQQLVDTWQNEIHGHQLALDSARDQIDNELQALTVKVAELQARLIRLDALGERVAMVAKLDQGEFDFSHRPGLGGPTESDEPAASAAQMESSLVVMIDQLIHQIDDREQQLELLDTHLVQQDIKNDLFVAGRPIRKGWMSSAYGYRTDPFHGKKAWHAGVDFAGKEGADVVSVAGGVVTWSGKRYGYGNMVEINHGDGYVTRYAHNRENLVAVGDAVSKGQAIARMGSSGRSTGPHVHFEVYRHGKTVDPEKYIYRASR